MQFTREINRVLLALLFVFGLIGIFAAYWGAFGTDTILQREDNPRLVLDELSIVRGDIVDRNGAALAASQQNADGSVTRLYPQPAAYSAVGYYSFRYGVNGAEAAYDLLLRGDTNGNNLGDFLQEDILHLPQRGTHLQLTFDLEVQQSIVSAIGDYAGAAVVVSVPTGEVLALVSLPTFDPNLLDAQWEMLVASPRNPFFNRVLQGGYQPGGTLQTALLATALNPNIVIPAPYEAADQPVTINGVTLNCLTPPPTSALSLAEAYQYGCPSPFGLLAEQIGLPGLQTLFSTFKLTQPPTLEGFVVAPETAEITPDANSTPPSESTEIAPSAVILTEDNLLVNALGQGELTVTPLEMALITASVINNGNAPLPYTLRATRPPDATQWMPANTLQTSFAAMMTADAANRVGEIMIANVESGTATAAQQAGINIGGHVALAYSGEGTDVWFTGFALLPDGRGVAIALVLEDSEDITLASQIGGQALAAAVNAVQNETNTP